MAEKIMDLSTLTPAAGSVKKEKRIGRGRGSGHGDTATRGDKGYFSRSGSTRRRGFEGGQMPLQRRVPKRGFNVPQRTEYHEVALEKLDRVVGDEVSPATVRAARLVKGRGPVVLLGVGEVSRALKVSLHRVTASARAKIEAAGGTVEIIQLDPVDRRVKRGPKVRSKGKSAQKAKQSI